MKFFIHLIPGAGAASRGPARGPSSAGRDVKAQVAAIPPGGGDVGPGCGGARDEAGQRAAAALTQGQAADAAGGEFLEHESPKMDPRQYNGRAQPTSRELRLAGRIV